MLIECEYQVIIDYLDDSSSTGCEHDGPCRTLYTMPGRDAEGLFRRWQRTPRWVRRVFGSRLVIEDRRTGTAHVFRLSDITDIRIQPTREAIR